MDCARYLLANGADRSVQDTKGNSGTSLRHMASHVCLSSPVCSLYAADALSPPLPALHYAGSKGYLGLLFMLLSEFSSESGLLERCVRPSLHTCTCRPSCV